MDDANWNRIETIIDEVLDLPEGERQSFINQRCSDDLQLKGDVTILLESIFDSEGWLEEPKTYKKEFYQELADDPAFQEADRSLIGKSVGKYVIREKIGEGGMGSVYLAEREDGKFDHRVAIKIIRAGRATQSAIRRFQREQQILAGLNHPGIARMFDGGITDEGSPYIIMEYVDGTPINEYCQKTDCSIKKTIDLFKQALEAVRHAHENLVIHRDLKPGNILVNEEGTVKILDFGISKLIENKKSRNGTLTQTGVRLHTPKYAAPEQIRQQKITTATDMYALGIIFYELLAGNPPFDPSRYSIFAIEKSILEQDPRPPSTQTQNAKNRKQVHGDLDAIALKAIDKEPDRRYRTANAFLDDLKNFEKGLPVIARDYSFGYQFGKFVNRHLKPLAAAATVLIMMAGLVGFYTWRIAQERNQARIEAEKAQNVKALLVDIFEANDPISGDAETASLPGLLDNGTEEILEREIDPKVRIELLFTLSTIYQNITEFDKAEKLAREILEISNQHFGPNSINVAKSYIQLGGVDYSLGNYKDAKKKLQKAVKIIAGNPDSAIPEYAELYHHLGLVEEGMSHYDSSKVYFQKALDNIKQQTRIDTAIYIDVLKNLGRHIHRTGNYKKADSLMFVALKTSKKYNGNDDVVTASIAGDIGLFYMTRAKYDSSRIYYQRSLDIKEKLYKDKPHPNYSATLTNLGVLETYLGNDTVAESLFTKTLAIDTELYGNNHPYVAFSKGHLAEIYQRKGQLEKARKLKEEKLRIYRDNYDSDHYNFAGFYKNYAVLLSLQKEFQKANSYFRKSANIYSKYIESDHKNFAKLFEAWGEHLFRTNQFELAAEKFEKSADIFNRFKNDEYKIRGTRCLINAGKSYAHLEKYDRANEILGRIKGKIDSTVILKKNKELQKMIMNLKESLPG